VALALSHFEQMAATDIPQRNDKGVGRKQIPWIELAENVGLMTYT
jgi:hypothetical protein